MRCGSGPGGVSSGTWKRTGDRLLAAACFDAVRCSVHPSVGVPCAQGRRCWSSQVDRILPFGGGAMFD